MCNASVKCQGSSFGVSFRAYACEFVSLSLFLFDESEEHRRQQQQCQLTSALSQRTRAKSKKSKMLFLESLRCRSLSFNECKSLRISLSVSSIASFAVNRNPTTEIRNRIEPWPHYSNGFSRCSYDIASVYSDYAMDKSGHVFGKLTLVAFSSEVKLFYCNVWIQVGPVVRACGW